MVSSYTVSSIAKMSNSSSITSVLHPKPLYHPSTLPPQSFKLSRTPSFGSTRSSSIVPPPSHTQHPERSLSTGSTHSSSSTHKTYKTHAPSPSHHHRQSRSRALVLSRLHLLSLTISTTSLLLFSMAIPRWNANFFHSAGSVRGDWADSLPLGPLVLIILLSLFSLLRLFQHNRPTRTIQKVTLGLHTLTSLALVPTLVLASLGGLFRLWTPAQRTAQGLLKCNMLNICK